MKRRERPSADPEPHRGPRVPNKEKHLEMHREFSQYVGEFYTAGWRTGLGENKGEVAGGPRMKYFSWLTPIQSSGLNLTTASSGSLPGHFGPGQVSPLHVPRALCPSPQSRRLNCGTCDFASLRGGTVSLPERWESSVNSVVSDTHGHSADILGLDGMECVGGRMEGWVGRWVI